MRILYSLLLIVLFTFQLHAKNYFVSKSGSDENAGTQEAPFLTIAKASSLLVAGDTCFIMAGTYREEVKPLQNGEPGNPIVYTSFQNELVLISATEVLNSWQVHQGDIYKASYKMILGDKNRVFCGGEAMDWARYPNNSDNDRYTVEGAEVSGGSASTIESSHLDGTDWTGGYVWYLGAHSGASWTRKITASQAGKITFTAVDISKWPFSTHNPTVWRENEGNHRGQFFVFGKLEALDKEQEWYYDQTSETVYFQAPGNVDPTSLEVEVTQRERTFDFNSKNYIHVVGLNAFGGKAEITGTDCEIRDCTFKNCLQVLDDLNNTSAQVGNAPVHVRAARTLIHNNVIDGSSLNGIFIQGWNGVTEVTISNNLIKNCNTVGIHASPLRSAATNSKFISNTIQTSGRDGIYCGGTGCEIAYNDVSDVMRINNDGGLFYVVGNANDKNNEVHHNWFHDSWGPSYADGRCAGIYLDNHSKGYSVHHNVVWNITWAGIQINWDNWNIDIYNNSIYNIGGDEDGVMGRWANGFTIDDLVIKNNYGSQGEWIGTDISTTTNIISAGSPFRSVANHDFRPAAGSALIDGGEVISGITDGYQGTAPDIGAYEDGLTPWIPGVNSQMGGEPDTPVGIRSNIDNPKKLMIYPNPLKTGSLNFRFPGFTGEKEISIYNNLGQKIYNKQLNQNETKISRNTFLNSGVYLVRVESEDESETQKIVVN
ncbi:T9SS type A sorting domain-containing protein [uncultured Draconibacterium sp.]|uniref:T9SS type A sorting domain-containing protein n=1 Tax=uncultured Draconibacterium sp. TaxID=1573823 RepID=UPI0025F605D8|nr:T9SS type A sorting domain-containing protein [uncultured Draconibacterium sp.]